MAVPVYKVLLIGDANVGKSSIIRRVLLDEFDPDYTATVGVDLSAVALNIDAFTPVILTVIDLGGQEDFDALRSQYYKGAHAALFVFDITDKGSFTNLEKWLTGLGEHVKPKTAFPSILLGNKCDISEHRQVTNSEARLFAENNDLPYFETSAKDGMNINSVFQRIAKELYTLHPPVRPSK